MSVFVHNGRSNTSAAAELAEFRKITTFQGKTQYFMNTLYKKYDIFELFPMISYSIYTGFFVGERESQNWGKVRAGARIGQRPGPEIFSPTLESNLEGPNIPDIKTFSRRQSCLKFS